MCLWSPVNDFCLGETSGAGDLAVLALESAPHKPELHAPARLTCPREYANHFLKNSSGKVASIKSRLT